MKRNGWFSQLAKDRNGSHIYSTPVGGEIEVTIVADTEDGSFYKWSDAVFVGPVVMWMRRLTNGEGFIRLPFHFGN